MWAGRPAGIRKLGRAVLLALLVGAALSGAAQAQAPATATATPKITEWINRRVTVPQEIQVQKAPVAGSPAIGSLRQGASVLVLGVVQGGGFVQIRLPDGQTLGYVPQPALAAALQPAQPASSPPISSPPAASAAPAAAAPPAPPVTGPATVVDTAALVVGGQMRALSGIQGLAGTHAKALQDFIGANGGNVTCEPADPGRYTCRLPNGTDVAMAALVNGSAAIVPGAPDSYAQQQMAARAAHRGLWREPVNPAQPLPAENSAPAAPSGPGLAGGQHRPDGHWLNYADPSGADCGIETGWRGGTARLALDLVNASAGRMLVITLRDDGWNIDGALSGEGTIVVDRSSMPVSFEYVPELGHSAVIGRLANPGEGPSLLLRLRTGSLLWVTSPLGRTPALSLAGAAPAVDALSRCLR